MASLLKYDTQSVKQTEQVLMVYYLYLYENKNPLDDSTYTTQNEAEYQSQPSQLVTVRRHISVGKAAFS